MKTDEQKNEEQHCVDMFRKEHTHIFLLISFQFFKNEKTNAEDSYSSMT